jgi:hypothetical protein
MLTHPRPGQSAPSADAPPWLPYLDKIAMAAKKIGAATTTSTSYMRRRKYLHIIVYRWHQFHGQLISACLV